MFTTPLLQVPWPGRPDLLVKDESHCETGTFKDRLAWRLAKILKEEGAGSRLLITTITLGNTLVSLSAAFADCFAPGERPQLLGVFPEGFSTRTIGPDRQGRTIRGRDVLNRTAMNGARFIEWPLADGYLSPSHIRDIAREAGLIFNEHRDVTNGIGVPAYEVILEEAWDQGATSADVIVVPVGAGVLFDEFVRLVERRGSRARVLGVTTLDEHSVADKIFGRYSTYFAALSRSESASHALDSRHRVLTVTDSEILAAMESLPSTLDAEPSAAAAFALLNRHHLIDTSDNVLVVNTGNGINARI